MAEADDGAGLAALYLLSGILAGLTRRGVFSREQVLELIDGAMLYAELSEASSPEEQRYRARDARDHLERLRAGLETAFRQRP